MSRKIVLGLSGGVDSAAAALRLTDDGWDVTGVWLDLGFGDPEPAREAARQLGVAFSVFDAAEAHEKLVRLPFGEAYRRGLTPNPCAVCNPRVKLPSLLAAAAEIGAERIATGHYAAIETRNGRACLRQSGGEKDQSYMLSLVDEGILSRLILPLSGLTKPEIRALAASAGLTNADAPDSQDICFIPDGDYGAWLEARGFGLPEGDFTDADGNFLGRHRGLHRYTIGQRRGLGVSSDSRLYVTALDGARNRVILGKETELLTGEVRVSALHFGLLEGLDAPIRAEVKLRSRPQKFPALLLPDKNGLLLRFDAPVRRPAAGQIAAAYDAEGFVLLAGTIAG